MSALALLVLGQALAPAGSLVVPDPLARDSVNVGRLDAGVVASNEGFFDAVRANTVDAGVVYARTYYNPDGGVIHAPAGVAVDTGYALCLNGAEACSSKVYQSPGNQLVLQGMAGITGINGATFQATLEAGSLSANSVELVGGATSATVRAASGTGATPDARLRLQAGGPDGIVDVVNGAGLQSARIGNADAGYLALTGTGLRMPTTAASGECSQTTGGYWAAHVTEVRPDAGVVISPIWCNGGEKQPVFIFQEFAFGSAAPGGGGLGAGVPFRRKNPERAAGQIAFGHVDVLANGGPGGNTYTVDVLQNGVVLCSLGPIDCAATGLVWDGRAVAGSTGDPPCPATAVFVPRTAADGPAFNIAVQFAGTCSTWPTVTGAIDVKLINLNSVLP